MAERICELCNRTLLDGRGGCEGAQHGNAGCAMNSPNIGQPVEPPTTHRKETRFGFEFGALKVTRTFSVGNLAALRVLARETGKYVDITVSPHGRRIHISEGRLTAKALATWLEEC